VYLVVRDILPPELLQVIRDRYLAGVADAEATFSLNEAEEDSLTGALGQSLATVSPQIMFTSQGMFSWRIYHWKVRGRGAAAPEKRFGTDGIFQIEVFASDGHLIRAKGLPFQAKKNWRQANRKLFDQAKDMRRELGGGIIINYSANDYKACSVEDVIEYGSRPKGLADKGALKPLGQLLGSDFLDCKLGSIGLTYSHQTEKFFPRDVVGTVIEQKKIE
jgi:hypothetical protein